MKKKRYGFVFLFIAVAYFFLPVDLIPDIMVGLGQIDDAIMLGVSILTMIHQHKVNRQAQHVKA